MPTIAIIGASNDRRKFGNKALRAFRKLGYTVVPINPRATSVEGERAYASVLDYPEPIDEATLYVKPGVGMTVVEELARKGVRTVWLNPGADAPEVADRARALGVAVIEACSIMGLGERPADY